jgi:hypothetical protein
MDFPTSAHLTFRTPQRWKQGLGVAAKDFSFKDRHVPSSPGNNEQAVIIHPEPERPVQSWAENF